MKTLVYRMGGLGDSLLIFPILEILKKKGHEITVWGNTDYFILAKLAGFCEKITFYEPKENFENCIFFSSRKDIFTPSEKSVYINPLPEENIWIVEQYLKKLNLNKHSFSDTLNPKFTIKREPNLCIIHPGSGSRKKITHIHFFFKLEKLLRNLGFEVLYILGPAEINLFKKFKNNVLCINNSVELTKTLLRAELYIGFDSGVSHLSSYLGIPSVVIFGPTNPTVWHPIGKKFSIIRYDKCEPCFPKVCDERKCMDEDFIIQQILLVLSKNYLL